MKKTFTVTATGVSKGRTKTVRTIHHVLRVEFIDRHQRIFDRLSRAYPDDDIELIEVRG